MNGFIANTDYEWYSFLLKKERLEEVNFWRPMGGSPFRALRRGEPLIFKLKSAHGHAIVGFGLFVLFRSLSILDAWQFFGTGNGAESLDSVVARVRKYTERSKGYRAGLSHEIGCVLLATPIFFPRDIWIRQPADWHPNIVQGKGYDLTRGEGRRIWNECIERASLVDLPDITRQNIDTVRDSSWQSGGYLVKPRYGQGLFRLSVADAYGKCAVSREHSLPALDAAHVVPHADGGPNEVSNGLLLRADIHRLFDRGFVTVTPDYTFRVSTRLDEDFHNGKTYYMLDGNRIWLPSDPDERPARERLEYHSAEIFRS